mmetsp:Transcript_8317/g.34246  ORF Transcript_8317/g.34246 Transcript_8317/m.34246 type:complete len:330 (-) Transcript_8317:26-1015(-)
MLNVDAWIEGLNALLEAGLRDHAARPTFDAEPYRSARGGEQLMALQNRAALWGRSVVSNCWADGGNPDSERARRRREAKWAVVAETLSENHEDDDEAQTELPPTSFEAHTGYTSDAFDASVAAWLLESGVRRVVVGHRPVGDSPAILSAAYHGVELITADTSYSDVSATDNRGLAVAAVVLEGPSLEVNRATVHGVLADGQEYAGDMPMLRDDPHLTLGAAAVSSSFAAQGVSLGSSSAAPGMTTTTTTTTTPSTNQKYGGTASRRFASSSADTTDGHPWDAGDPLLGTRDAEGWWYKATVEGGAKYRQCRGEGRLVEYRTVDRPLPPP